MKVETIAHGDKGFLVATCQSDELLIGGGFYGNPGIKPLTYQYPEKVKGTPKHIQYVSHQDEIILCVCISIEVTTH